MLADVGLLSEELDLAWFLTTDKVIEALLLQESTDPLVRTSGR